MRVDGLPGVRTCVTAVRPGMRVEREHAWPSARLDVLRASELFSPLLPPGFYYRWFRRSPRLWGAFERGLAHVAGQGDLPSGAGLERLERARCQRREGPDVLVVGGGVAGLSAALAAAGAGADVLLVEQDERLGGRLAGAGVVADDLVAQVTAEGRIEVLTDAEAIGWYEEGAVAIDRRPDLLLLAPRAVVLATGAYDLGLPFAGWDLPGVMLAEGARRLLLRHGVKPGSRAVVITTDDAGHEAAGTLAAGGVEVACIADCRSPQATRPAPNGFAAEAAIPVIWGAAGARAHGFDRVRALTLLIGGPRAAGRQRYDCDLVCVSAGVRPADDLALQAASRGSLVLAQNLEADVPGLWLAGLASGSRSADAACEQGGAAGAAAARSARG